MPIELYRRHTKACKKAAKEAGVKVGVSFSKCNCPVWAYGTHPVTGDPVRHAVGTKDWSRAVKRLDRWEAEEIAANNGVAPPPVIPTIKEAIADYMKDCKVRKLAPSTLRGYTKTMEHFETFCKVPVNEITTQTITAFRNLRADSPGRWEVVDGERRRKPLISANTLRKEMEAIKSLCAYLVGQGHLKGESPSKNVRTPKPDTPPTMPFEPEEVKAIIAACNEIDNNNGFGIDRARLRAHALVLLLLYSGMRISDAIKLERWRLATDGRLKARQLKTGGWMYVKLPEDAMEALNRVPVESKYFLWSGASKLSTAVGSARRTIDCLGRMTGINAHPHRFRDTFSIELLNSGASLRTVQLLLGHKSIKTTEEHYAPWVKDNQRQLDEATAKLKFG